MGLVKLAIIGGASYWAVKKIRGKNHDQQSRRCSEHCNHHSQNNDPQGRDIDSFNANQQYHNNTSEKSFHDQLTVPYSYANEKADMQTKN